MEEEPQKPLYEYVFDDFIPGYGILRYYTRNVYFYLGTPEKINSKALFNLATVTAFHMTFIESMGKILTGESVLEQLLF